MSWLDHKKLMALATFALLSGCGFQPLYGPNSAASQLDGRVAVAEIDGEMGFAFRERLTAKMGSGPSASHEIVADLTVSQRGLAISDTSNITRYNLTGTAAYRVVSMATGLTVAGGDTRAFAAYSATASPVATRSAERDARVRLAQSLAEQVALEVAADAGNWMP